MAELSRSARPAVAKSTCRGQAGWTWPSRPDADKADLPGIPPDRPQGVDPLRRGGGWSACRAPARTTRASHAPRPHLAPWHAETCGFAGQERNIVL